MPTVTDDRFLWSRLLLAVLSVGFLVLAAAVFLSGLFADPGERPRIAVLVVSVLTALGRLVLATLGGVAAWAASGVYGVLVAGGVMVVLFRHPGVWLSEPMIGALLLAAAAVGVTGIVIAIRSAPVGREREDVWRAMVRFRGWIVAALVAALLAVGAVVWTVSSRTPQCGAAGVAALTKAADQLRQVLPALEVDPEMDAADCGFDGTTYADWSYPGLLNSSPMALPPVARSATSRSMKTEVIRSQNLPTRVAADPDVPCPIRRGGVEGLPGAGSTREVTGSLLVMTMARGRAGRSQVASIPIAVRRWRAQSGTVPRRSAMPSGYLPGLNRTGYRVGAIVMIVLGVLLSILTFTGVIGGGIVMGILWIVVALAGAVGLADALRNG